MKSVATDVDSYLNQLPADKLEPIKKLRALCKKTLKGYTETMNYGMPSYEKNGICEAAFARQKNYVSIYILKQDAMNAYKDDLKSASLGKGCIRYANTNEIDFEVI